MYFYYKATIEYDGTCYFGIQKQKQFKTIQSEIERILSKIFNQHINIIYSGRTDTGVHATGQVINFKSTNYRTTFSIIAGVNSLMQKYKEAIVFIDTEETDESFNSRHSAVMRQYVYKIINRTQPLTFQQNQYCWEYKPLDAQKMHNAAQFLIGYHDFSSFRASGCQAKSALITLKDIGVQTYFDSTQGNIIEITINAKSFLYHMVRNIVSALIEVGKGNKEPIWIQELLQIKDRNMCPATASPKGLYLSKVFYDNN